MLLISDYGYLAGGAELMILRLRDELRARGHDARLFSTNLGEGTKSNLGDYSCFGTHSRFRTLLQTFNPSAAYRLAEVVKKFQPNVVHIRMFLTQLSPLILPVVKAVPTIYHMAWYRPICPTGTKLLPNGSLCQSRHGVACLKNKCLPPQDWPPLMTQMRMLRKWSRHFDLLVANSNALKTRLEAEDFGPVEVVHNGVPVAPLQARPLLSPIVAFAGRLTREKGADVLVKAIETVAQELPETKLLIAGDGPERHALEQQVRCANLERVVRFLGHVDQEDMADTLQSAWVHVVPSLWVEPFGIVAVEAMARGQAVIASNHGGLPEIVDDGATGILVPPDDSSALAQAILRLLRDPNKAEAMGRAGYDRALKSFSMDTFCDRFVAYYRELVRQV